MTLLHLLIHILQIRIRATEDPAMGGEGPQDQGGDAAADPQDRQDCLRAQPYCSYR